MRNDSSTAMPKPVILQRADVELKRVVHDRGGASCGDESGKWL